MAFSMLNATAAVPVAAARRVRGSSAAPAAGKPALKVQLRASAPLQRAAAPRGVVLRAATGVCAVANLDTASLLKEKKAAKPLNLVFVSAEVAPWSKTGGLGDVVRVLSVTPLPKSLNSALYSQRCGASGAARSLPTATADAQHVSGRSACAPHSPRASLCAGRGTARCSAAHRKPRVAQLLPGTAHLWPLQRTQVGSLPVELAKRGHKVMTISPRCVAALTLRDGPRWPRVAAPPLVCTAEPTPRSQLRSVRRRVGHRCDRQRDGRGACLRPCRAPCARGDSCQWVAVTHRP